VIAVVRDPRPFAAGPSFRRPELFVHYPACGGGAGYYHMADEKAGGRDISAMKPAQPKPVAEDELVRVLEMSDKATDITPKMSLPQHPEGARNPADKGMAVIRPFIPRDAFRKAPTPPKPMA
jgi:hypothetical protein